MNLRTPLLLSLVLLSQSCFIQNSFGQLTKPLEHYWEISPNFGDIWGDKKTQRVIRFDVNSLNSPRMQDRVSVARMISREHKNPNFKQRELAIELLLARLKGNDEAVPVRRAMISAVALIDDGKNAAALWQAAQDDPLSRSTVEKALMKWKSPIAIDTWRKRLADPMAVPAEIATAIDGLTAVGSKEDNELFLALLKGHATTPTNRHLAAVALGQHNKEGLNELAQQVLGSDLDERHLLAAKLLSQHTSDTTLAQLRTILNDGSNVAKFTAAQALVASFPKVAREYATEMIAHPDSNMRLLALQLLEPLSDEESLRLQSKLLNDRNIEIRRLAGTQLVKKAKEGQLKLVDEFITEHLNAEPWPGIEQATLMLVSLEERPRCAKLVELLEHPRAEVNMHAGWALMELAQDPAILASIVPHVEKATSFMEANGVRPPLYTTDTIRLSFLHEAFGRNKYQPAEDLLMRYVPKNEFKLGFPSRASAIWALGQLNKGENNEKLRKALFERIADLAPFMPEDELVRFSCILALGEMGFEDSLPTLKKFNAGKPFPVGYACDWAIEQINKAPQK